MKAVLRGGPVEGRVIDDVPEETEFINIPANTLEPKHAHYQRVGDHVNGDGKRLLFDFVAVYPGMGM